MTDYRRANCSTCFPCPAGIILFIALSLLFPFTTEARITSGDAIENGPWRLSAEQLSHDQATNEYSASGDVVIARGGNRLRADRVRFNRDTMVARAAGNVHFTTAAGDSLVGDRLVIDLESGTGTLYNGLVFVEENHFFIKGDRILKTGESTYRIEKAGLTACEQKTPDWRITGSEVNVTVAGYGTVKHSVLWIKKIPVFYVPFFMFPAKTERQSGLLPPQIDFSGRKGFAVTQPFFWAINESSDATFYYQHLQKRGEKLGVEYRYMLSEASRGTLMLDGFDDRKIDDGTGDSTEDWGYENDNALRPNSDRYWFRMKANQELPNDFTAKLDLDVVSDQDYLREFSSGYMGYSKTSDYFESEFGRDLDDKNDPVRENRLNFSRNWTYSAFNADFAWYDNVINRRQRDEDDTLQRLPMITFNALKQPFYNNLVYSSLYTEYDYFYRTDGPTGHRTDLHPRLFLPIRAKNYFTFEPSISYRQTVWYSDEDGVDDSTEDKYAHRELFDLGAQLSTDVHRIYNFQRFGIQKIKHTVVPMLEYSYIPDIDQSELPDFDEIDRIDGENEITFSLTHYFTSKRAVERPDAPIDYQYNLFGRLRIEQPYDFNQRNDSEKALGLLYTELDFTPVNLITLHADAEWSHELEKIVSSNLSVRLRNRLGASIQVDYRYNRLINESVYFLAVMPVTSWLSVYGDYERNLVDNEDIELQLGALYKSGCWSVDVSYLKEENDRRFGIMVNLYSLGEIGNRL